MGNRARREVAESALAAASTRGKLVYMVHDIGDPAVERRVRMFLDGGIEPTLLGFHRSQPLASVCDVPAWTMGRTDNARLLQRARTIAGVATRLERWKAQFGGATTIVARNLEMLLLASIARRRFAPEAALVYECLDVHGMLVTPGPTGAVLRALERRLLQGCGLLIVSSPAFVSEHFSRRYGVLPAVLLLENKLLHGEVDGHQACGAARMPSTDKPWRIGWFGVIRCRRSLMMLSALCQSRPGLVEVVIRGRVARNVLPDFEAVVAGTPGMAFLGAYDRKRDLPAIYGDVHFSWAIDFYEAGFNSAWLLPNRVYEGTLHGAVPLALAGVQTGRWLAARGAGVVMPEPLEDGLVEYFDGLDAAGLAAARAAVAGVPAGDLVSDRTEAVQLVDRLLSLPMAAASGWERALDAFGVSRA